MKVIFFGTPEFSVPTLERLIESRHDLALVVTRPDRPRGRHLRLEPPPVKVVAERHGLPVIQPEKLTLDLRGRFEEAGADVGVVVAYGQLLPGWLLELPRHGFVNVHPSLVPRHRGAAPMERALFEGDSETGVSILKMGTGLDDGPVYLQERFSPTPEDDAGSLRERCAKLGADLIVRALDMIERGEARPVPQSEEGITYAEKLQPHERFIDWREPAERTINRIRALSPRPGATTTVGDKELKIYRARPLERAVEATPGTVVEILAEGPVVATGSVPIVLEEVQLEGKSRMSAPSFLLGFRLEVGQKLGSPVTEKEEAAGD